MLCVVITVYKYDCRLVINEAPKNGDHFEDGRELTRTHVFVPDHLGER
jgi:hypothetical protein